MIEDLDIFLIQSLIYVFGIKLIKYQMPNSTNNL